MCVCVPETDRRPHKSSCKWPELNWLGLVAAVLVWGIVSFLYLEKLEERGDGGEPAGSRKCVLRAAINDSIECLMAPYKASTRSSRCTYSLSAGKVERRQLFSLCAVTVKLWQGAFNILKCFSCAVATSCRPVCLNCLSQLSAWVNALMVRGSSHSRSLRPASRCLPVSRCDSYQKYAYFIWVRTLSPTICPIRTVVTLTRPANAAYTQIVCTLRIRPVAQSRSEHHKFQFTHTLTRFMSQSSHAPTKFTNPPIRQSVDHQLRP